MWAWRNNIFWDQFGRLPPTRRNLALKVRLWLCFFSLRLCLIADVLGPSVLGNSPGAVVLDVEVVDAPNQPEVAAFAPIAAPRVPNDPVLDSVFFAPSSH